MTVPRGRPANAPPLPTDGITPAAIESENGSAPADNKPKISPASLPKPKDGTDVDVDVRLRYDTTAEDISRATVQPQAPPMFVPQPRKQFARAKELSEWLAYWRAYEAPPPTEDEDTEYQEPSKFKMLVVRKPDGYATPNTPQLFNVPCNQERELGEYQFITSLNDFIQHLQSIEVSGGNFRVVLFDGDGDSIKLWGYRDRTGSFHPTEPNYYWEGQISNPRTVARTEGKAVPGKEKDFLTQMEEYQTNAERMKRALGIKEETGGGENSVLKELQAGTIPVFVASLLGTLQDTTKKAIENSASSGNEKDRGFLGTIAHNISGSEEMSRRVWNGFDTVTTIAGGLATQWLSERQERLKLKLELDRMKFEKENPEIAARSHEREITAAATEKKEDIYDYIMRKCEARADINIATDAEFAKLNAGERAIIRGMLTNLTTEEVLDKFVLLCETKGKGERAREFKALPHVLQFIERMQRPLKETVAE